MNHREYLQRTSEARLRIARSRNRLERRVSRDFSVPLNIVSWFSKKTSATNKTSVGSSSALLLIASLVIGWWSSRRSETENPAPRPWSQILQSGIDIWHSQKSRNQDASARSETADDENQ